MERTLQPAPLYLSSLYLSDAKAKLNELFESSDDLVVKAQIGEALSFLDMAVSAVSHADHSLFGLADAAGTASSSRSFAPGPL